MSALGQKQTLGHLRAMSALPPKADIGTQPRDVRFVPKADILRCEKNVVIRSPCRRGSGMRPGSGQEVLWTSSDRRIACSSLSAEIRFTRPLVPGVGRSRYADVGCAQGGRPALAQICEIGFSRLDPVDQFRVAGIATQHQEIDRQTD